MSRKYNILMMVSWYTSLDGTMKAGGFHREQAKDLNKYCNCAVYCPYDRSLNIPYSRVVEDGIVTYRSGYKLEKKIRNRVFMIQAMKQIIKDFHPDLIHGNVATEAGRFAVILGKMFHIPVIITEHSAVEASGVTSFPHHFYAKHVYAQSRYNACVSDDLRNKLTQIFPKYTFHTIYNGVQVVKPTEEMPEYRQPNRVNIGMVTGFYDPNIKGIQFVLPAMKRLKDEGYSICLHIIGGGDFLQEYVNQAEKMGLQDICIFYGRCEKGKLYSIESQMDFTLSASIFESFGCAVAEGMMLGKPCVATKSGGVESIINQKNGILIDKGSCDAIYEGIIKMYQTYSEYHADIIEQDACDRFSIDHISKTYMEIYKNIILKEKKR